VAVTFDGSVVRFYINGAEVFLIDGTPQKGFEIGAIVAPLATNQRRILCRIAGPDALRAIVKLRQYVRQLAHHRRRHLAGVEQKRQHALLR
jgi:hypothetical protein